MTTNIQEVLIFLPLSNKKVGLRKENNKGTKLWLTSQYLWASKSVKNPMEDCWGIPLSSAKNKLQDRSTAHL